ncbi:hypothetical protein TREMEDRAFT_63366 [Tremella mesenterica DSM 1558]|uniref:uncharacterized protein n=1 Tax=Tremella mesenterica (strain ATCC 24925 / CBS 8224 / DSM 1558 / NBRC 9311 / NRRL Y-6157 / RJB 2259-6 / UBC 559-6) TaxID=578456 RepID=UPI0003F4A457|nr:uncharacterized protein TREMEDRAFT_63366 [Tremella mesenterica DSM 1558]EIW68201.1 hypothetical protein TREMEDRAFT_63366 [Tremella mesenterica DSM 1558]
MTSSVQGTESGVTIPIPLDDAGVSPDATLLPPNPNAIPVAFRKQAGRQRGLEGDRAELLYDKEMEKKPLLSSAGVVQERAAVCSLSISFNEPRGKENVSQGTETETDWISEAVLLIEEGSIG